MIGWTQIPPEHWPRTVSFHTQTCAVCGLQMEGTDITNARGPWEHFTCARAAYETLHGPWTIGTQRQLVDALKEHKHLETWHDPTQPDTGRYAWRKM